MLDRIKSLLGLAKIRAQYIRPLKDQDINDVLGIEQQVYNYPWSRGIFKDCLRVGYSNWALIKDDVFVGYAILSVAVGEAHILNICVDPSCKRQGLGQFFLNEVIGAAKTMRADCIFLEVRLSNVAAIELYKKMGFKQIGQRKNYYPAAEGKEDAMVYSLDIAVYDREK
ncbi:MAG TPA: ribosomal-protein-alanine N-acetyltransferase [Cycloclasticus sp.]|jgi:ribosomal-protein-alanine N-acetyltransferase|nr:ribosomal-protein-alanine N-acetyltransferase [Cycloclasticus sp.]HIL93802.1 ribosomal-protein-alanine N-acetyltransferase [Cycloclasticus sp.]